MYKSVRSCHTAGMQIEITHIRWLCVTAALDYEDHIKDLGVTFDEKLDFNVHIAEKVNKAYIMLWLIKRNFNEVGNEAFILLYKHLVRAHLEYNNSVWAPYKRCDIEKLEKVQKQATKMFTGFKKDAIS